MPVSLFFGFSGGITPAYAGKSGHKRRLQSDRWDHPHICGEKAAECIDTGVKLGSPPRMRGKVKRQQATAPPGQDHPRVCGEKETAMNADVTSTGSPPRMRGKGSITERAFIYLRITPAYAGKSAPSPQVQLLPWDHPRVCGEKLHQRFVVRIRVGSPPRMRGKAMVAACLTCLYGITPAYAGKSSERMR